MTTLVRAALDVDAIDVDALVERVRATCAATCHMPRCTGKGSRELGAHLCQLLDEQPELLPPPCALCGQLASWGRRPAGDWRCSDHAPTQGVPVPTESLPRRELPPRTYGTATTDPLGRDGDGWHINAQTKLPSRDRA